MVQVQVRIEVDSLNHLTLTLDVLRREDVKVLESKLADKIEAQILKTFSDAAEMVGAPIYVKTGR